jgi:hypothetical protein
MSKERTGRERDNWAVPPVLLGLALLLTAALAIAFLVAAQVVHTP